MARKADRFLVGIRKQQGQIGCQVHFGFQLEQGVQLSYSIPSVLLILNNVLLSLDLEGMKGQCLLSVEYEIFLITNLTALQEKGRSKSPIMSTPAHSLPSGCNTFVSRCKIPDVALCSNILIYWTFSETIPFPTCLSFLSNSGCIRSNQDLGTVP